MAETDPKKRAANWADMDNEEGGDDDQEIGIQGGAPQTTAATEEQKNESPEGGEQQERQPRKKKDYGDKYDPNYHKKKNHWRKGNEELKKPQGVPAIQR